MIARLVAALQVGSTTPSSTASTTRRIAYLPSEHTDFIFSVSPDAFSLVRLAVVVVLLAMIVTLLRRRRTRNRANTE
jgi:cell division protein FtsW (lipid II flippase)